MLPVPVCKSSCWLVSWLSLFSVPWRVAKDNICYICFCGLICTVSRAQWQLIQGRRNGHLPIGSLSVVLTVNCFQIRVVSLSLQEDLPLPSLVEIESSNHYTKHLLNPDDRQISSTCQTQMTGNRQICFSVLLLLCLNQASIISDNLSFPDIMDLALGSVQSCSLSQVCLKCDNWTHV